MTGHLSSAAQPQAGLRGPCSNNPGAKHLSLALPCAWGQHHLLGRAGPIAHCPGCSDSWDTHGSAQEWPWWAFTKASKTQPQTGELGTDFTIQGQKLKAQSWKWCAQGALPYMSNPTAQAGVPGSTMDPFTDDLLWSTLIRGHLSLQSWLPVEGLWAADLFSVLTSEGSIASAVIGGVEGIKPTLPVTSALESLQAMSQPGTDLFHSPSINTEQVPVGLQKPHSVLGMLIGKRQTYRKAKKQKAVGKRYRLRSISDAQLLLTNPLEFEGYTLNCKLRASMLLWSGSHWLLQDHTEGAPMQGKSGLLCHPLHQSTQVWARPVHLLRETLGWSVAALVNKLSCPQHHKGPPGPVGHCTLFSLANKGLLL